jgi:hypothetical protein
LRSAYRCPERGNSTRPSSPRTRTRSKVVSIVRFTAWASSETVSSARLEPAAGASSVTRGSPSARDRSLFACQIKARSRRARVVEARSRLRTSPNHSEHRGGRVPHPLPSRLTGRGTRPDGDQRFEPTGFGGQNRRRMRCVSTAALLGRGTSMRGFFHGVHIGRITGVFSTYKAVRNARRLVADPATDATSNQPTLFCRRLSRRPACDSGKAATVCAGSKS